MNHSEHFHIYQICLAGHLDERWFGELEISRTPVGETVISGFMDQAALHGVLNRIRDLGLVLISVQRISTKNHDGPLID